MSAVNNNKRVPTRSSPRNNPSNGNKSLSETAPNPVIYIDGEKDTTDPITGSVPLEKAKRQKVAASATDPTTSVPTSITAQHMDVDASQAIPLSNALIEQALKEAEKAAEKELAKKAMLDAAKDALKPTNNASLHAPENTIVTPPEPQTTSDSIHAPPSAKGKEPAVTILQNAHASGSTPNQAITPITKVNATPRTTINRSVRFRIYTPATTFGNKTDANIRSIVL